MTRNFLKFVDCTLITLFALSCGCSQPKTEQPKTEQPKTDIVKEEFKGKIDDLNERDEKIISILENLSAKVDKIIRENNKVVSDEVDEVPKAKDKIVLEEEKREKPLAETPKPPSVISSKNENTKGVPVYLEFSGNNLINRAYFKITNKKTKKSFTYEVDNYKVIEITPGEYTVQLTTLGGLGKSKGVEESSLSPQTFTVEEEPMAEIRSVKVHAVIRY